MKQQEFNELQAKVKELQEQLDNADIENGNPFNLENSRYCKIYYDLYRPSSSILEENGWYNEYITAYVPCKDKSIVEARQKRHHLSDLLEKFAWDNDAVVTESMWKSGCISKYYIDFNSIYDVYSVGRLSVCKDLSTVYFTSEEVAQRAITEIVEPFMAGTL